MKYLLKLEELGVFVLSVFLLYKLNMPIPWWLYGLLFFSPDLGMLGYVVNTKTGAATYNFLHHKAVASILLIIGIVQPNDYLILAGLLIFAHSSFDRVLGYGLKYADQFKHTHLGYIGNAQQA